MPHLILLGDSILDNAPYVGNDPDVHAQVEAALPTGWQVTRRALDGTTTDDIDEQLSDLPDDATHLVLSVGGNDALARIRILNAPVSSSAEALLLLAEARDEFEHAYRRVIDFVRARRLPLLLCTIYNANFPDRRQQRCVEIAVAVYDDVILRVARERDLPVIDLRTVCTSPEDYLLAIEPSAIGGEKIARAIAAAVTGLE